MQTASSGYRTGGLHEKTGHYLSAVRAECAPEPHAFRLSGAGNRHRCCRDCVHRDDLCKHDSLGYRGAHRNGECPCGTTGHRRGGRRVVWAKWRNRDDYLEPDQYTDIRKAAGSSYVYYLYSESDSIEAGSESGRSAIYAMDDEAMKDVLTLTDGSFPPSTTSQVVVGPDFVERYGIEVGSKVTIGDEEDEEGESTVRVTGILEERGLSMDLNSDNAIIATEKFFTGRYDNEDEYTQVNVIVDDINDIDAVTESIDESLNRKDDEVQIQDSSRMLDTISSTLGTITTFAVAIAAISLLVAAVSIFNVMMMSVTERIREIGILRSIGTQKDEILRMFVYEAGIIGIVGAGIGAILSVVIGYVAVFGMVGTTEYFFTWESIANVPEGGMIIGAVICILSGVYPAWRASNLDPIEALRAE